MNSKWKTAAIAFAAFLLGAFVFAILSRHFGHSYSDVLLDLLGPPPEFQAYLTHQRYTLFQHPHLAKDQYLVDTMTGQVWNVQVDQDKNPVLVPVHRQN